MERHTNIVYYVARVTCRLKSDGVELRGAETNRAGSRSDFGEFCLEADRFESYHSLMWRDGS